MPRAQETLLEIHLNHLEHNYNSIRAYTKSPVKFMAVVKAFAYGTGVLPVAKKLEQLGTDYFAVAYASEGIALREAGIKTPILVLHPQLPNLHAIIENCLEPSLYSMRLFDAFSDACASRKVHAYPVHIKCNTGLNRLGFPEHELDALCDKISGTESVRVTSVFSHLAASEDPEERPFTLSQIDRFNGMYSRIQRCCDVNPWRHMSNTSGIVNYPEAHFEMVRSGIGLYGYGNQPEISSQLKPVAVLKSCISQIHQVRAGDTVGYNRAFKAAKQTVVATLPIGHADGISRFYGNGRAGVLINSNYAPIVGNVCMDMIMVDVTGVSCEEGDEVIIIGDEASAERVAEQAGTIAYELLATLSPRIHRVIVE